MPDFNIASEQSLGMSHSGEKTAYGEYVVNLTDEEVKSNGFGKDSTVAISIMTQMK